MKAYLIVDVQIFDPVKFRDYAIATSGLVEKAGGKYLALGGGDMACLEGTPFKGKSVISEWPSRAAVLAFWHSPEYAEARKLREGIANASVTLLDGVAATPLETPK